MRLAALVFMHKNCFIVLLGELTHVVNATVVLFAILASSPARTMKLDHHEELPRQDLPSLEESGNDK